ncbi:uncharacterized protein SCODWIG_01786 [Saccharomycodes ludwigii]|uniref:Xylanolytic transcriptional activator regulatory domain-containing protein n=1 Tax=Saccharomycodes ludwigii TaxID=36035 RepID=A0A376B5Q5_9ASCO|nr:uncharacterized protein SCODWIG_01786 [Saccharomycodes ludwigii]
MFQLFFKSKTLAPFFTESVKQELLLTNSVTTDSNTNGSQLLNFVNNWDRLDISKIIDLIPKSENELTGSTNTFFNNIHPIIPILDQNIITRLVKNSCASMSANNSKIDISDLILIFTILFTTSYTNRITNTTKKSTEDLFNQYCNAYRSLLDISGSLEYGTPRLGILQSMVIISFVMDPNMRHCCDKSAFFIRQAQQLGINKSPGRLQTMLWHFILYMEGSSSVVNGMPFLSPNYFYDEVELPSLDILDKKHYYMAFTVGRFIINEKFRLIMDINDSNTISMDDIVNLYGEINKLCDSICKNNSIYGRYFSSTLYIFLYRVHLRYMKLLILSDKENSNDTFISRDEQHKEGSLNSDTTDFSKEKKITKRFSEIGLKSILGDNAHTNTGIVEISILLLFHTCIRLQKTQKSAASSSNNSNVLSNFLWYTLGSTPMQYLFVVIKDLYNNNRAKKGKNSFEYAFLNLGPHVLQSIPTEVLNIVSSNVACAACYPYLLVDVVIMLLETHLLHLWTEDYVNKFILVKYLKGKVWEANSEHIQEYLDGNYTVPDFFKPFVSVKELQQEKRNTRDSNERPLPLSSEYRLNGKQEDLFVANNVDNNTNNKVSDIIDQLIYEEDFFNWTLDL